MPSELMERPLLRAGLALHALREERRRMRISRLLHVGKILLIKEALELTDQQVVALRDLRAELGRKLVQLTAEIENARLDSFKTIAVKPVNFDQLRANAKTVSNLRLQRKLAVIDVFEKASKVLNNGQKEKLSEFLSAWADETEEEAQEA